MEWNGIWNEDTLNCRTQTAHDQCSTGEGGSSEDYNFEEQSVRPT